MQTHEVKNEKLELNVENQEFLGKMPSQTEDGQCPICNERVSGFHYGLATCEGCKGFFRRTVQLQQIQNESSYKCSLNQNCIVDKITRTRCLYCRFQKCLAKGMKTEAVKMGRLRGDHNKLANNYKMKASADSDDGHGKEKGNAEMENSEDDDDDFVRLDFSALDISEEEGTKNAPPQSLLLDITALKAKVETLEAKNEMLKSKLENQELKAKMQKDSLEKKLEQYEHKMGKLTKEMTNLSVENQKLKPTDFEALKVEMLKNVQIEDKEQPEKMDELKKEWAKMFAALYDISDRPVCKEWLDDWLQFMHQIGKPVTRLPIVAEQVLDLFEFYRLVVQHGGLVEVIQKKLWPQIIKGLPLPTLFTCACAAFTFQTEYAKYLYDFECHRHNFSTMADLRAAVEGNENEGEEPLVTYINVGPASNY